MRRLFVLFGLLLAAQVNAAITLEGSGATNTAQVVGTTGLDLDYPASVAADDVLVTFYGGGHGASNLNGITFNTPSGWTKETDVVELGGTDRAAALYADIAAGTESGSLNFSVTDTDNTFYGGFQMRFDGVDTTTPMDATPVTAVSYGDSGIPDPPAITTVTNDAWVVTCVGSTDAEITAWGAPTNYTLIASDPAAFEIACAYREITTAGAEDPGTWNNTASGTVADQIYITFALRPATASGPTTSLSDAAPDLDASTTATISAAFGAGGNPTKITIVETSDEVTCDSATSTTCEFTLPFAALDDTGVLNNTKVETAYTLTVTNGTETSQATAVNIQTGSVVTKVDLNCTAGTNCDADSLAVSPMTTNDDCIVKVNSGTLNNLTDHCSPILGSPSANLSVAQFDESLSVYLDQNTLPVNTPSASNCQVAIREVIADSTRVIRSVINSPICN